MNEFIVSVNGKKLVVTILPDGRVDVNGRIIEASFTKVSPHSYILRFENIVFEVSLNQKNQFRTNFLLDGLYYDTVVLTRLQEIALEEQSVKHKTKHHTELKAPMPGLLVKIKKQVGQSIERGETILILEAMKMENDLHSPSSGIIKQINFNEGDTVEKDAIIVIIE